MGEQKTETAGNKIKANQYPLWLSDPKCDGTPASKGEQESCFDSSMQFFFCVPQLYLWGSPSWEGFLRVSPFFLSNHWGSHIPALWMVHARCVFVAGIHRSKTWMSGSFESLRWNACVHGLDFGLYSHLKEFWRGMESEPMLTPRKKSPLPKKILLSGGLKSWRCIKQDSEPHTLPTELFQSPKWLPKTTSSSYRHLLLTPGPMTQASKARQLPGFWTICTELIIFT